MSFITFREYVYYGVLVAALAIYLPMYIKIHKELDGKKRKSTGVAIVASFAAIGVIGVLTGMVAWFPALISSILACLCSYYIVFVKYRD